METKEIKIKLDNKASEIIKKLTGRNFRLKNNVLYNEEWALKELKKTEAQYQISLWLITFIIVIIIIAFSLKTMGFTSIHITNDSTVPFIILVLNSIGTVCLIFRSKIKIERLRTLLYLSNIKQEIEKLKPNKPLMRFKGWRKILLNMLLSHRDSRLVKYQSLISRCPVRTPLSSQIKLWIVPKGQQKYSGLLFYQALALIGL